MVRHDVQYVNASWTSKTVCHTNFLVLKASSLFHLHLKIKKSRDLMRCVSFVCRVLQHLKSMTNVTDG
jgi:hypothetical protein